MNRWPEDVPELYDGAVRLRAHRETDLPGMVEMCRDPETTRWMSLPDPYGPANADWFVREVVAPGWRSGAARGWPARIGLRPRSATGRIRMPAVAAW
ncbi:hypothetical protein BH24ACT9_BH24ACT9_18200 [soil metagenome]